VIRAVLIAFGAGLALGLAGGAYGLHTWHKAQRVDQIEEARTDERAGVRTANQADVRHLDRIFEQRRHAENNAAAFRRQLEDTDANLGACRVSVDLLGVLDDAGLPADPGPAGDAEPAAARAAAASTCDVELDKCRVNYAEVCVPNRDQVNGWREFYRRLQLQHNKGR
jgi:hypothetical protein